MLSLREKKKISLYDKKRYLNEAHNRETSFSSPYNLLSDIVKEINHEISRSVIFQEPLN